MATERSNLSLMLGRNAIAEQILARVGSGGSPLAEGSGSGELYEWSGLDRPQRALILFWITYAAASVAALEGWTLR